jgi:hypothetical protein
LTRFPKLESCPNPLKPHSALLYFTADGLRCEKIV